MDLKKLIWFKEQKIAVQAIQNRPDSIAGPCVTMKAKPFSPNHLNSFEKLIQPP